MSSFGVLITFEEKLKIQKTWVKFKWHLLHFFEIKNYFKYLRSLKDPMTNDVNLLSRVNSALASSLYVKFPILKSGVFGQK